jgi:hypothetical protein
MRDVLGGATWRGGGHRGGWEPAAAARCCALDQGMPRVLHASLPLKLSPSHTARPAHTTRP